MEHHFVMTLGRVHRTDSGRYVLQGYFRNNAPGNSRMTAFADGTELPLEISYRQGLSIRQKYFSLTGEGERIDREYDLWIRLPKRPFHFLRVIQEEDGERSQVFRISYSQLQRQQKMPEYYLETWQEKDGKISIGGWACADDKVRILVIDEEGNRRSCRITRYFRQDIVDNYPEIPEDEKPKLGFEAVFEKPEGRRVFLLIGTKNRKTMHTLYPARGEKNLTASGVSLLRKAAAYYRRNGLEAALRRTGEKIRELFVPAGKDYMDWKRRHDPSEEELKAQRDAEFAARPLISIVVPLYRTDIPCLKELVSSVKAQTYENWELCFSDGSGEPSPLKTVLEQMASGDRRIKVVSSKTPLGISENTNEALKIAQGDYIAFCDHDDLLAPCALYEFVRSINKEPDADFLYSDEDKVSMDGKTYFEPHFKPDFSPVLLTSMNYICHMVAVRRDLLEKTGGLNKEYDGAQDYDFVLRACEKAEKIVHVCGALYHWRSHKDSTAQNPASKRYAFEAGRRAVQAYYDRRGIRASVIEGRYPGLYETIYEMPEEPALISILIPSKDHWEDLEKCIRSLEEKSTYRNFEIIVIENNSTDPETFAYYKRAESEYDNVRVVYWDKGFNYAKINNFGARHAGGEYLLLLNNDTTLASPDSLTQMLGAAMRPDAGIVGARLLYPDDTIQHAGVIIGYGGLAGHAFAGMDKEGPGYFSRIIAAGNYSAVTAACLLVSKKLYEELGGLDEEFVVAFNDVDFCLRAREAGKWVTYLPSAVFYHYESKSRGYEDSPEKIARFNKEADLFLKRWKKVVEEGDPFYNPSLSLDRNDFSLS